MIKRIFSVVSLLSGFLLTVGGAGRIEISDIAKETIIIIVCGLTLMLIGAILIKSEEEEWQEK